MTELMTAIHALLVVLVGVVIYLLRNPVKSTNGAGELYKRIEAAEQRIMDALRNERGK